MILFVGLAATACQSPQLVEDRLVAAFGETMFGGPEAAHDHAAADDREPRLSKWQPAVTVSVVEGATDENTALVKETLERFADLTHLDIEFAAPGNTSAQLKVYFSDMKDFLINDNEMAACFTRTHVNSAYRLEAAEIYISRNGDGNWRDECVVHEFLHAFGWRGHTHRVRSAVSYMHGEKDLTRWDAYLMRTLYDPRLRSGTTKAKALPTVRTILHSLLQEK